MVRRKDRHAVELLLESGAKVNAVGDMGETPLHVAVAGGDERIIGLLLKAGASPTIRSEFGDTPFERAKRQGGSIAKLVSKSG